MKNEDFRTLAYNKSPKTSKRTTFQDELQAAVFARADKTKMNQYSDDFTDDDDDDDGAFLKELLKSKKKKTDAFKAGRSKGKINHFEFSDDEDKNRRTKRVSFLKTPRVISPLMTSDSHENEPPESSVSGNVHNNSFSSQFYTNVSEDNIPIKPKGAGSTSPQTTRENPSKSPSYETSAGTQLDTPLALPSDSSVMETPAPLVSESHEEKSESFHEERSQTPQKLRSSTDSVIEKDLPRPKPRKRTVGLNHHSVEKETEAPEPQDLSRSQTSSASLPVSNETSSTITKVSSPDRTTAGSCSPHTPEGDHTASQNLSKSSSQVRSEQSQSFTKSTVGSGSTDGFISEGGRYSTSFEEYYDDSGDHSDYSTGQFNHVQEKSSDARTSSSLTKRSQRVSSAQVESKYLGTLKVLDRKVSLQESQPQWADALRAAIYQEWLKKKTGKFKEMKQLKKQEEMLKEKRKKEEEAKKEDAVASYLAWKEKKAESLKAKAKEKQDLIRKEQRATEEKEEKRQSAKQEFEKWKQQQDHVLREKYRKLREAERKCNLTKQEKEEEKKRDGKSAFSNWYDKKKNVLSEKVKTEREENKYQTEEEQCKKEERDKMALEMYENWLARKELEQKRQREERRIQAILRDSPPPPWSPPNKTIPFRK